VTRVDWTPEAAEKGGFAHFMLKEIHEQPQALRQCLAGRLDPRERSGPTSWQAWTRPWRAWIGWSSCCGSASYAALVGAAAVQEWTGLPARVTVGSEFRYSHRRSTRGPS